MELINAIPKTLIGFLLVALFSLIIGLSQRLKHVSDQSTESTFGTDRTFTFIGIFGFILYILNPSGLILYVGGGLVLSIFLAINYYHNILKYEFHGITTILIALITYTIGPLVMTQPYWLVILIIVTVLIFTELKESFYMISKKIDKEEFITLGKFLIIAGVILPIVPNEQIFKNISLTPYNIWLAIVVVSTISYMSYLLKKFVFRKGSIIISGILGGLYSSTATTIILARKSKTDPASGNQYIAGVIFATAMMYLRIMILIMIFSYDLFRSIFIYLIFLFILSALIGVFILFYRNKNFTAAETEVTHEKNPLEFKVALIFTVLYIAFTFITYFVLKNWGTSGLNVLSFMVGLTDIDPFLVNLFQGKFSVTMDAVSLATLQAIISNNVLKMIYACFFSGKKLWFYIIGGFILIIILNSIFALVF